MRLKKEYKNNIISTKLEWISNSYNIGSNPIIDEQLKIYFDLYSYLYENNKIPTKKELYKAQWNVIKNKSTYNIDFLFKKKHRHYYNGEEIKENDIKIKNKEVRNILKKRLPQLEKKLKDPNMKYRNFYERMYNFELEMNRINLNSGNIIKQYLRKNLWNKNYNNNNNCPTNIMPDNSNYPFIILGFSSDIDKLNLRKCGRAIILKLQTLKNNHENSLIKWTPIVNYLFVYIAWRTGFDNLFPILYIHYQGKNSYWFYTKHGRKFNITNNHQYLGNLVFPYTQNNIKKAQIIEVYKDINNKLFFIDSKDHRILINKYIRYPLIFPMNNITYTEINFMLEYLHMYMYKVLRNSDGNKVTEPIYVFSIHGPNNEKILPYIDNNSIEYISKPNLELGFHSTSQYYSDRVFEQSVPSKDYKRIKNEILANGKYIAPGSLEKKVRSRYYEELKGKSDFNLLHNETGISREDYNYYSLLINNNIKSKGKYKTPKQRRNLIRNMYLNKKINRINNMQGPNETNFTSVININYMKGGKKIYNVSISNKNYKIEAESSKKAASWVYRKKFGNKYNLIYVNDGKNKNEIYRGICYKNNRKLIKKLDM